MANDEEWTAFLRAHLAAHPSAGAQDVYKLLHQACFGPGHIIADADSARSFFDEEWAGVEPDGSGRMLEPIDPDGMLVRVHMAPAKAKGVPAPAVFACFLESAGMSEPGDEFLGLWRLARGLVPEDQDLTKLDALAAGDDPPPVRHSKAFAEEEKPHYRVACMVLAGTLGKGR